MRHQDDVVHGVQFTERVVGVRHRFLAVDIETCARDPAGFKRV